MNNRNLFLDSLNPLKNKILIPANNLFSSFPFHVFGGEQIRS